MNRVGTTRIRLAKALQRDIPTIRDQPITWSPERLYRRVGRHLKFCDAYSWHGSPVWTDSGKMAGLFDCWHPMTECLKASRLVIEGTEIETVDSLSKL